MNYTVLGASGFVGRHLAASLQSAGHGVYAPDKGNVEMFRRPLGHVFYCIGLTADFRTRPFDTVRAHVSVLADVLEKADFDSLVYLSSTRVYGRGFSGAEQTNLAVDVADPSDLYNLSKLAGESLCRSCGRSGVKVARLSNVVGPDHASENFLYALIREAFSGRIELQSDPESSKDYILISDVVSLLPRIGEQGRDWIYNVGSGINVRHRDIGARLADLTGCEVAVRPNAPRFDFPAIDVTRIRSEFDFSAASVLDTLPGLVAAYQALQNQ
jgi:nucleoside-diphosphate-sugar epimerase